MQFYNFLEILPKSDIASNEIARKQQR